MPAKRELSLLPDSQNVNSPIARALKWVTTVGRVVIVFTELIVISAFLSRFWLDRRNSDLSEVIRQQKAILESTSDFEKEYTVLQKRLKAIKDSYSSRISYHNHLKTLIDSTSSDIIYNALSFKLSEENKVVATLDLITYKEDTIIDFVTNLTVNPDINNVEVHRIEKKPKDTRYHVSISFTFADNKDESS